MASKVASGRCSWDTCPAWRVLYSRMRCRGGRAHHVSLACEPWPSADNAGASIALETTLPAVDSVSGKTRGKRFSPQQAPNELSKILRSQTACTL